MKVYTSTGAALYLREPPIGHGGEGAIYDIVGYPNKVAKIYLDRSDADAHRDKIEAMASASRLFDGDRSLCRIAWPQGALYTGAHADGFVGFGMRKLSTPINIDALYEYPPRADANFSMRDKLDTIRSLADLTERAHEAGQVIGDYNDNNVRVMQGCLAALVDADSFQAQVNGRVYPCVACLPGYAAPEVIRNMHGFSSYAECTKPTFTQQTDDWALAVHVFRVLFNGVHPYHCLAVPDATGSLPAVLPIDKRIERGETPFFRKVRGTKLPPFAPSTDILPSYLREMFVRAFINGQTDPSMRPSAAEWGQAIERYERDLQQCRHNAAHWYRKGLLLCPYCEADARTEAAMGHAKLQIVPSRAGASRQAGAAGGVAGAGHAASGTGTGTAIGGRIRRGAARALNALCKSMESFTLFLAKFFLFILILWILLTLASEL